MEFVDRRAEITIDALVADIKKWPDDDDRKIQKKIKQQFGDLISSELELQYVIFRRNGYAKQSSLILFADYIANKIKQLAAEKGYGYISREDVIEVLNNHPDLRRGLAIVPAEEITVDIKKIGNFQLQLNRDQLIGISSGIYVLPGDIRNMIIMHSSLTNEKIDIENIVDKAKIYQEIPELATEELKRPYRVMIGDRVFRFKNVEFMQGVLSVGMWFKVKDKGRGKIWDHLEEVTKDGIIPLGIS